MSCTFEKPTGVTYKLPPGRNGVYAIDSHKRNAVKRWQRVAGEAPPCECEGRATVLARLISETEIGVFYVCGKREQL